MSSKTLLIVDDSLLARRIICAIIHDAYPDWDIVEANGYDDAIEKTTSVTPDIATVDLNMPGKDGLELIEALKVSFPELRAILLTANIQDRVRQRALEAGAEFLEKPVKEDSLLAVIRTEESTNA